MQLIANYRNAGFEATADGVMDFFGRREDLQRPGVAFGSSVNDAEPDKISTDISLVAISHTDPESFAFADLIVRAVSAALLEGAASVPSGLPGAGIVCYADL